VKPNQYKRVAAGRILLGVFSVLNTAQHMMYLDGMKPGLTLDEVDYLKKLQYRTHKLAELDRKFAWRLIKS